MSINSFEASGRPLSDISAARETSQSLERRRRIRLLVHWKVCFWGGPLTEAVETVTQDLSSEGFYCLSKVPFVPGERLACSLRIPAYSIEGSGFAAELECRVQVIRTDPANRDGLFGMGCRIEEYRITVQSSQNS